MFTHKKKGFKSLSKAIKARLKAPKSFFQKIWKKAPKEWLAVGAIVLVVGVGIYYNLSTVPPSEFKGTFPIQQGVDLCPSGYDYNAEATCSVDAEKPKCVSADVYKCCFPYRGSGCSECAAGYAMEGNKCVKIQAGGERVHVCETWQEMKNGKCIAKCNAWEDADHSGCIHKCYGWAWVGNATWNTTTNECVACPPNTKIKPGTNTCESVGLGLSVLCPEGMVQVPGTLKCAYDVSKLRVAGEELHEVAVAPTCEYWETPKDGKCVNRCYPGDFFDHTKSVCWNCPAGKTRVVNNECLADKVLPPEDPCPALENEFGKLNFIFENSRSKWDAHAAMDAFISFADQCLYEEDICRVLDHKKTIAERLDLIEMIQKYYNEQVGHGCVTPSTPPTPTCQYWEKVVNGQCVNKCQSGDYYDASRNVCYDCPAGRTKVINNVCTDDGIAPLVPVPEIISPKNNEIVDNGTYDQTDRMDWTFVWKPVSGATNYEISVIAPSGAQSFVQRLNAAQYPSSWTKTSYNTYVADHNLTGWQWQIRAEVKGRWSNWSSPATFQVERADTDKVQQTVQLSSPAHRAQLREGDSWQFNWYGVSNANMYHLYIWDSAGQSVIDTDRNSTSWSGTIDVSRYMNDSRDWTWQVGARLAGGNWIYSEVRSFDVIATTQPPVTNKRLSLAVSLIQEKTSGSVDARIRIKNDGNQSYSSNNISFHVKNLTYPGLGTARYGVDYAGNPAFRINDLKPGTYSQEVTLYDLPSTDASGNIYYEIGLYENNVKISETIATINYNSAYYNPYYRPPYSPDYRMIVAPAGPKVTIRGVPVLLNGEVVLIDTDDRNPTDRLIAYLVEYRHDRKWLDKYLNVPVEVTGNVAHYSCDGSTISVTDIRKLTKSEPVRNSLDALYRTGAICYIDVDTRPIYSNKQLVFTFDDERAWYVPYAIRAFKYGIMRGDNKGYFNAAQNIKVAEAVKMAVKVAGIQVKDESVCVKSGQPWYCEYMKVALANKWLSGNAVNPESFATRADVIRMLMMAYKKNPASYAGPSKFFRDLNSFHPDFGLIESAATAGIVHGYPDHTFRADALINRAEVAKIYVGAFEKFTGASLKR